MHYRIIICQCRTSESAWWDMSMSDTWKWIMGYVTASFVIIPLKLTDVYLNVWSNEILNIHLKAEYEAMNMRWLRCPGTVSLREQFTNEKWNMNVYVYLQFSCVLPVYETQGKCRLQDNSVFHHTKGIYKTIASFTKLLSNVFQFTIIFSSNWFDETQKLVSCEMWDCYMS